MTKQRIINGHKMQQRGKQPHAKPNFLQRLTQETRQMRDRDRLLTKNLADVCNALADALGLPADEIDPNRLPEYVKDVILAERSRCACVALTTPCPQYGPQTNPIAVLAHAIADEIRKGEPRKCG